MLSVLIEPNDEMKNRELMEIKKSTIGLWFDYLSKDIIDQLPVTDGDAIAEAWQFWHAIGSGNPNAEKEDGDLGHCRLWILVSDGLPSKVGFVRGTGMLITTQQPGLLRFRGLKDFIAVCVFDSEKGNELLRMMENPQHDRFEPHRLPEQERRRGKRALKRVVDWIREEISRAAAPPTTGGVTDLGELAAYLPDLEHDEDFDSRDRKESDPDFGGPTVIRLKPRRPTSVKPLPVDADGSAESEEGGGDDFGDDGGGGEGANEGGGGNGIGPHEGAGKGGKGGRGGGSGMETIPITDVRLVPVPGGENRYRVSFVAGSREKARLEIGEAGDSTAIEREDLRAFDMNGEPLKLDSVQLTKGERTVIEITGGQPIGGRAWRVRAVRQERR